jgi:GNAT superfamily N-acetyltransferase
MNALIKLAREHAKEMRVTDELPFDDIHYTSSIRKFLIDPSTACFVVERGDYLIGYAIIYSNTKVWNPTLYCEMAYFYIMEGERNKMLADSLWKACIDKAHEWGAKWFETNVSAWGKDYLGSQEPIERASRYFEHKQGDHCGNMFVHKLEEQYV